MQNKRARRSKFVDEENPRKWGSFKGRKSTMKNKASELATLCDVTVCVVCFGPEGEVQTWPERETEVDNIINKYKGVIDQKSNKQKMHNLVGFLESKKKKAEEKLNESVEKVKEVLKENIGNMFSKWDPKLKQFSPEALMDLCNSLDSKLNTLRERIQFLQQIKEINYANAIQAVDSGSNNPNPSYLNMLMHENEVYEPSLPLMFNGEFSYNQEDFVGTIWPGEHYPDAGSSGTSTGQCNINNSSSNSWFDFGRQKNSDFVGHVVVGNINNNLFPENNCCFGFVQANSDNLGFMGESS